MPMDRARIGQVLTNLLANALRHTPAGGTITVHTNNTPDAVTITVTDTGDGIATEHLPHVFNRFYRTHTGREAGPGSGLGLAVSQALAHAHDVHLVPAPRLNLHRSREELRSLSPGPSQRGILERARFSVHG
ncbi:Histidine kinase-, DNA gyrase B-, and HSP90-like ATPase [Micrococcus terreus]|uniref:histidine kinase n=2 Tax=Micrococcus terreus TaxID=574650 RepID=A0A1I7MMC8_9MICC|nr:Histidine kinase-, DNA gyrase B-, and HSP90-like ATPase [Micrococcus terreus]